MCDPGIDPPHASVAGETSTGTYVSLVLLLSLYHDQFLLLLLLNFRLKCTNIHIVINEGHPIKNETFFSIAQ